MHVLCVRASEQPPSSWMKVFLANVCGWQHFSVSQPASSSSRAVTVSNSYPLCQHSFNAQELFPTHSPSTSPLQVRAPDLSSIPATLYLIPFPGPSFSVLIKW